MMTNSLVRLRRRAPWAVATLLSCALFPSLDAGESRPRSGGGVGAAAASDRRQVMEWVGLLGSPFVDERMTAIDNLSQLVDRALVEEIKLADRLAASAKDPFEFERVRSQALRGLAALRDLGVVPVESFFETVFALLEYNPKAKLSDPQPSERFRLEVLSHLVDFGLSSGNIADKPRLVKLGQDGLKKLWDTIFAEYLRDRNGTRPQDTPLLPSSRFYGRVLMAFGALSHHDTIPTTDFLVKAMGSQAVPAGQGVEQDIFQGIPKRAAEASANMQSAAGVKAIDDLEILVGALDAVRFDLVNAPYSTTRAKDMVFSIGNVLKLMTEPSHATTRMAIYRFIEMLVASERAALFGGQKINVADRLLRSPVFENIIYPRLETTADDAEADVIVRIMMSQLDPKVVDRLLAAATPRTDPKLPQLHMNTLTRINSALVESLRQMLQVIRQQKEGSEPIKEARAQVIRIGRHFVGTMTDPQAPAGIRRIAAANLGFWPADLNRVEIRDPDPQTLQYLRQMNLPPYMGVMVVDSLVGAAAAEKDPELLDTMIESLQYLTGERFMIFDPVEQKEVGPDLNRWREWWAAPENRERFTPKVVTGRPLPVR